MATKSAESPARGALIWGAAIVLPLGFLLLFFGWPTATLIGMGFVSDGRPDFSGFAEVMTQSRTWSVIGQTLWMAFWGTLLSVITGLPGAFVLYRLRFPGRGLARALVAVPFVLPTVAVSVGFRSLFSEAGTFGFLGWEGSTPAIVAAMAFFNLALVARLVGATWSRLDPRPAEVAAALGASPVRVLGTVTLPALLPAIISAASVVFLYCATAYAIVLILGGVGTATIETEIYTETTEYLNLRTAAVLSTVQLVVVVGALWLAARARARQEAVLQLHVQTMDRPARRSDWPILSLAALPVVVLIIAPMAEVVLRSLQRQGEWTLANYWELADAQATRVLQVSILESLALSVRTALLAGILALVVGCWVAIVVSRRPRSRVAKRAVALLDGAFMLPLGVSAVTVGFGFLVTLAAPPLSWAESPVIVPAAQAVVAIPLVVRTVLPTLRGIDPRLREAASSLGASPMRVLLTIDGAYLGRVGAVAAGFAFAVALGEFGATSFLARPQSPTLPVVIFQLVGRPSPVEQGLAMSASVLLCLATATIMVAVEYLRGDKEVGT